MSVPVVSVCLAAHNGLPYVLEQVDSVLAQLSEDDELVIVDDASTDGTPDALAALGDPRVTVQRVERNRGHVATFEAALAAARGDVLVLCDQDDLWPPGRLARMCAALESADVVAANFETFGADRRGPRHPMRPGLDDEPWRNVVGLLAGRRSYFGSCMALRRELVQVLLPFPPGVEAQDHWLAIVGNLTGRVAHLDDVVTLRRLHGENLTPSRRRRLGKVARTRVGQLRMVREARRRRRSAEDMRAVRQVTPPPEQEETTGGTH